jgi:phage FluMu gp28-like protein
VGEGSFYAGWDIAKAAMAVLAKRRVEEAKVRLPVSDAVRQAFRSVKKTVNAVGQVRFDAEHDARTGHADHWWAFCPAEGSRFITSRTRPRLLAGRLARGSGRRCCDGSCATASHCP